jgi:hypothetical protein
MTSHRIKYEGLEFEVFGDWEDFEEETGYKGGWSTTMIKVNDIDIYFMLKENIIDILATILVEENY